MLTAWASVIMSSSSPSTSILRGTRRWGLWLLLSLVAVLGVIYWQRWNLVRWALQEALAYRLGATVQLGAVQASADGWELIDLDIEAPAIEPRLASVRLPRVALVATWQQLRGAEFPQVEVDGGHLQLAPTAPAPEDDGTPLPNIGELWAHDLTVTWSTGAAPPSVRMEARLFDLAGTVHGELAMQSARLEVAPLRLLLPVDSTLLASIEGSIEGFAGHLTLAPETVGWNLQGAATVLRHGTTDSEVVMPEWQLSFDPTGQRLLFATPDLAVGTALGTARAESLEIVLKPTEAAASQDPTSAVLTDLTTQGLDLRLTARHLTLQAATGSAPDGTPPDGTASDGTPPDGTPPSAAPWSEENVSLAARLLPRNGDSTQGWTLHAEPQLTWFRSAIVDAHLTSDFALGDLTADILGWRLHLPPDEVTAELDLHLARLGEAVEASLLLHHLTGEAQLEDLRLHPEQLPLRAQFQGRLQDLDRPSPWLDGTLVLRSRDDLKVTATGAWHLFESASEPSINVEVTLRRASLGRVQSFLAIPILPDPWHGDAVFSVAGRLEGPALASRGTLRVDLHDATLEPPPELRSLLGSVRLRQGRAQVKVADPPSLPSLEVSGTLSPAGAPPVDFTAQAKILWDAQGQPRRLDLESLLLTVPGMGEASVAGTVHLPSPGPDGTAAAPEVAAHIELQTLALQEMDPATLRPFLPAPLTEALTQANYKGRLRGSWQLSSSGVVPSAMEKAPTKTSAEAPAGVPTGAWHLSGPVILEDLGYSSLDGSRVMEGLQLRFDSSATISQTDLSATESGTTEASAAPWSLHLDGEASGFLLLWDTFYGDFSPWRGKVTVDASSSDAFSIEALAIDLELPEGPRLRAKARPLLMPSVPPQDAPSNPGDAADAWTYEAELAIDDLSAAHRLYLAPTFGEAAGNALSGSLSLQASGELRDGESQGGESQDGEPQNADGASIRGQLVLHKVAWNGLAGTAADGLELHLPFDWTLRGAEVSGPRENGQLRFAHLNAAGFELPAADTGLWTEGRALGLDGALELPVYGGRIVLDRLLWLDLLGERPRLQSAVEVRGIDMAAVAEAVGLPPLAGTLEGRLERLEMAGQELRVDGGGRLAVFGGYIEVDSISGSEVLSRFPRITLSATVHELDLGQLTQRLDFGEMQGTLQGSIDSCTLFRGVPVTCKTRFETVERPGVGRSVDVKAVNNLTVLGTGSSTNILDRGIQRFFKRFTYAAFGVDIQLADDALLLRGLETRGDKELFMRGRLPFPIDIINAQPGRRVSFQAMLQRLQTLDFSAATTAPPKTGDSKP